MSKHLCLKTYFCLLLFTLCVFPAVAQDNDVAGSTASPSCLPGDFDGDGNLKVNDVVYLNYYLFQCGLAPTCQPNESNGNCELDLGDGIYLVNHLFRGGPAPVSFCSNPDTYTDPGSRDTVRIGIIADSAGRTRYVPVYIFNDEPISPVIPLTLDTTYVVCDTVITTGTRGDGIIQSTAKYCRNSKGILLFTGPMSQSNDHLPTGSGVVAYLRCTIKQGAPPTFVKIDSTYLNPNKLRFFKQNSFSIKPVFVSGGVNVIVPGTVAGTVTNNKPEHNPIAEASVSALQGGQTIASTSTSGSGYYEMKLTPGTYDIAVSKSDYAPQTAHGIQLTAGQTTVQDFSLDTIWSQPPVEVKIESFIQNTPTDTIAFRYSITNITSVTLYQITVKVTAGADLVNYYSILEIPPSGTIRDTAWYHLPERAWENKSIEVEITQINGWNTSFKDEMQLSVFYLMDKDKLPYSLFKDAYSFPNWSFSKRQTDSVLTEALGTRHVDNKYLIPYVYKGQGGHCYGMAYSSNDYFERPHRKPPSVKNAPTYKMTFDNPEVVYQIILYHVHQEFTRKYWDESVVYANVAEETIASLLKSNEAPVLVFGYRPLLYPILKGWLHTVSPYKIIRFHTEDIPNDSSWVYYYDNIAPWNIRIGRLYPPTQEFAFKCIGKDANCIIYVDDTKDVFSLDGALRKALWTFRANLIQHLNGQNQQLSTSHQDSYSGELLSFALSNSDRLLITNKLGQRAGYANGTDLVNEIPSAEIYPGGGIDDTNYVVVIEVPKDEGYTITMFSQRTDTLDIVAICPETESTTTNFLYMDLPVVSGSQGTIQYDPHGASILNLDLNGDGSPDTSISPLVGMAPFPFDLISPIEGTKVWHEFDLKWTSSFNMDYQDIIFYQVYIAKDTLFSSWVDSTNVTVDTTVHITGLDVSTTYYWKVKAFDTQGNSIWSQVRSFEVLAFRPGDPNADGKVTVSDVVYLVNYMFKGGPPPVAMEAGDTNCDNYITVTDIVYLINYLFKGGPPPGC